jgi:hypothetical protein
LCALHTAAESALTACTAFAQLTNISVDSANWREMPVLHIVTTMLSH